MILFFVVLIAVIALAILCGQNRGARDPKWAEDSANCLGFRWYCLSLCTINLQRQVSALVGVVRFGLTKKSRSDCEARNRALTDIVAARDAALRFASFEALAGLALLIRRATFVKLTNLPFSDIVADFRSDRGSAKP